MPTYKQPFDQDPETMTREDRNQERLKRDETNELISSEKVDGTPVVNKEGEQLGKIHHFMVGKRDGKVRYAVMTYGGFLGMGEDYFPLPWDALTYDTDLGGYVVDIDKERLSRDKAPSFKRNEEPNFDSEFDNRIRIYYLRTA